MKMSFDLKHWAGYWGHVHSYSETLWLFGKKVHPNASTCASSDSHACVFPYIYEETQHGYQKRLNVFWLYFSCTLLFYFLYSSVLFLYLITNFLSRSRSWPFFGHLCFIVKKYWREIQETWSFNDTADRKDIKAFRSLSVIGVLLC